MRRALSLLPAIALLVAALLPSSAATIAPRLVVFESFLNSGCHFCATAAPALVLLADDYVGKSAVFLSQNTEDYIGNRYERYRAAEPGLEVYKPYVMLESGFRYTSGLASEDTPGNYTRYKAMVDDELARAPLATLEAYSTRVGDTLHVYLQALNESGVALSLAANGATASLIVYEDVTLGQNYDPGGDARFGTYLTRHYERDVQSLPLTDPLANAETRGFSFTSKSLAAYDWSKLHGVAFVEYRPSATSARYDMLQAVIPAPDGLSLSADRLQFAILQNAGTTWAGTVATSGPSFLSWTASSDRQWLSVSPVPLLAGNAVTVNVDLTGQPAGSYSGTVTFSATAPDGVVLHKLLAVSGSYGGTDTNCYALALGHSGEGADPVAVPASSETCTPGTYHVGSVVQLTAAPAANWQVASWTGTGGDQSTALTNTLTMPAAAHTAAANYTFRAECAAPVAPILDQPAADLILPTSTPVFTWEASAGADLYHLLVCASADCDDTLVDVTVADTHYATLDPLPSGTYFWRVAAMESGSDCLSEGGWSGPVRFRVCVPPEAVALLSPADGEATQNATPTFTWEAAAGAEEYEIEIDGVSATAFDTTYTPAEPLADGMHRWSVRAHSSAGGCSSSSDWSERRTLYVGTAPAATLFTFVPLLQ
jgi:hypothetical protein